MVRALLFCWIALASFAALAQDGSASKPEGMVLLTVGGLVGKSNRGPFDKAHDSSLAHLKADFKHAFEFDREMLLALPQGMVTATTPELGKEAVFKGPLLREVLADVEAAKVKTRFVASDGYSGYLLPEDIEGSDYSLALEVDGRPLGLGQQGPLWLVNTRKDGEGPGIDNRGSHVWGLVYMHVGD